MHRHIILATFALTLLGCVAIPTNAEAAYPTVVATSTGNSGVNTTASTITMPSGVSVGDLLIVLFSKDGSAAPTGFTGTGWATSTGAVTNAAAYHIFYWKIADGSDSLTINHANEGTAYIVYRITGHDPNVAPATTTPATGTGTANPDPPSLNPSAWDVEDTLWIVSYGWDGNVAHSSYPSTFTSNQITNRWANTGGSGVAGATLASTTASQDPGTATIGAEDWVAMTIAVRPVPVPPSPNPPFFTSTPTPASTSSISMTSTTTTSVNTPVEYYFTATTSSCGANVGTGGADRTWQASASYTNTGLQANKCYGYMITSRDSLGTKGSTSTASTTYTLAATPTAPTLSSVLGTTLVLTNNEGDNPTANPSTSFTIYVTTSDGTWSNKYVASDGTPNASPQWLSDSQLTNLTITGLSGSTAYNFYAVARNQNSINSATSTVAATTTLDATIPSPNPVYFTTSPTPAGTSSVSMTSVTATDVSNPVYYYFTATTSSCGANVGTGGTDSGWQTPESYTDTGLQANKCYGYMVTARDALGNTGATSTASTTYTLAATPTAPTLATVGTSTLVLTNNEGDNPTANPSTSFAIYVTTSDGTWSNKYVASDGTPNASPQWLTDAQLTSITIRGLSSATPYTLYSVARNQNSINSATSTGSATTTASLDSIFSSAPSPNSTSSISMTATVSTAPNGVQYYFTATTSSCGANVGTGGTDSGWQTGTSYTDTGLDANKCYGYTVTARDAAGVFYGATSTASTTYTLAATPTAPTLSSVSTSSLTFTNNEGFNPTANPTTNFTVYVSGTSPNQASWEGKYVDSSGNPQATPQWLSDAQLTNVSITGLTYNTSYSFYVQARNQDNILSGTSTAAATTTLPDSVAPTPAPIFSTAPAPSGTSTITMTTTVSTDDNGPVEYYFTATTSSCASDIGTGGTDSGWQTDTSYTDTGLQANKCYGYMVTARDALGNAGATSTASTTYTLAATPTAPTLASVTSSTIDLTNNEGDNPTTNPTTNFAIYVTTADGTWSNKYVDSSGNPQATPQWLTDVQLTSLTVTGLTDVTSYTFYSVARNENSINSATSSGTATTTPFGGAAGTLTLADHSDGQINNQFVFLSSGNDTTIFSFNMAPAGESATTTSLQIALSGVANIDTSKVSNIRLYRDINSDSGLDGGDVAVGGTGTLSVTNSTGTITFSDDFLATTTLDYIVVADLSEVYYANRMTLALTTAGVSATGVTSLSSLSILGSVTSIEHRKGMPPQTGGTGAGGDTIDGAAPSGTTRGGGGGGGGGRQSAVGDDAPDDGGGETIGNEPGFFAPTDTGDLFSAWTNGSNAYASDATYATSSSAGQRQSYSAFSFGIPGGNEITGIAVKLEAKASTGAGTIDVDLSWDNGGSWTSAKSTATLTTSDVVYELGGQGDVWSETWSPAELADGTFHVRLTSQASSNEVRVDALQVGVFHQATGGGGGAGGEILGASTSKVAGLPEWVWTMLKIIDAAHGE